MFYRPADGHGLPHDPFKALVVPRPIGWVSSRSAEGRDNLAPYSFFNGCGDAPPLVMFAQTGRKTRETLKKDSIANIQATGEFACNIVPYALKDAMNLSSGSYEHDVDEFEVAGLTKAPCSEIDAPRVAEAPAVLECKLVRMVEDLPTWKDHARNILVIGEVVGVHIDEAILEDGMVDVLKHNPLARMGYMDYTAVREKFALKRPGQ
ncbi:MAG: flavin reductase family protein [Pseudomonadota bacterium]